MHGKIMLTFNTLSAMKTEIYYNVKLTGQQSHVKPKIYTELTTDQVLLLIEKYKGDNCEVDINCSDSQELDSVYNITIEKDYCSYMKNTYSQKTSELIASIITNITPVLTIRSFEQEINYNTCKVEILNNDFSTIWVKWGSEYNCEFKDLPIWAMATIADNILS